MNEKSLLKYFKLRTSNFRFLIPLFISFYYFIGYMKGQVDRHFMNAEAIELKESDLD